MIKLPNIRKINLVLWKANNKWWKTHSENEQGYMWSLATAVHNYINKNVTRISHK